MEEDVRERKLNCIKKINKFKKAASGVHTCTLKAQTRGKGEARRKKKPI